MDRSMLTPRWLLFHAVCLLGVVVMVNLGLWQLDRLDQRREFNALVEQQLAAGPQVLDDVVPAGSTATDTADSEWLTVQTEGVYDDARTLVVVNRGQGGVAGQNVVTPLVLADGRVLLVNRGFVPLTSAIPPAPTGEVTVLGHLRLSQERRTGELTDSADAPTAEIRRIDIPLLQERFDEQLLPVYLERLVSDPAEVGDITPLPEPTLDEGPHLSYAIQWFVFAACVVVGWVIAVRRSIGTRRRRTAQGEPANT